ncbi:odorant receptor 13a-like isoform X1 [Hylaeus volcanicus]|uniref:odorant receptor 13a-like isoform X1 n=1 Tax=Hylaeus volcanicus TaxID=313075 RepID=UPI0023B80246|nr:odorant receptor 13a-like isoform X1 [Hylaeus volcanicus]XP_053977648.1 odorant receptor 13a-like isoform X1 [Hylaeus volcanicus]
MQTIRGEFDSSIRLTFFFMKCIGAWVTDTFAEQIRGYVAAFYTLATICTGIVTMSRDMYFSRSNVNDLLFASCNVLSVLLTSVKIATVMIHKTEFFELISHMKHNFWHAEYNDNEKEILGQSWKICILFVTIVTVTGHGAILGYIATPIIDNMGKNESDRVLIFNMWVKAPLWKTPYYEMMFFLQISILYHVSICYFTFDNILCIISIHLSGQFRILQYRLETYCHVEKNMGDENGNGNVVINDVSKSYEKLKNCIRQHQRLIDFSTKLENVFTLAILAQVVISSALICLLVYLSFLDNSSTVKRCGFISFTMGSSFMLLMFTYSCHVIVDESNNIAQAAYSGLWPHMSMNRTGKSLRRDLMIVIARSRNVCSLTAFGFFPISLETYTKIMSSAVSYFTILKQSTEFSEQSEL